MVPTFREIKSFREDRHVCGETETHQAAFNEMPK